MKQILLTGASGFIGLRYVEMNRQKYGLRLVSLQTTPVQSIDYQGIDTIVHLAGKAHSMTEIDPKIYYQANYELTRQLAETAKKAGVRHFVFMSTVNVYGTESIDGVINEDSPRHPETPYGDSKRLAEDAVLALEDAHFKVAVIRTPLVYGPRVKGNLLKFLQLAAKPWPLPFGGMHNQRSMVFVDNLVALTNAITDQKANGVFLATDAVPISTELLISEMRKNMGKPARLFAFPALILAALRMIRPQVIRRLYGSFVLDGSKSQGRLGYTPPFSVEDGIKSMTQWFAKKG